MSPKGSLWRKLRKASKPQLDPPIEFVYPLQPRVSNTSPHSDMVPPIQTSPASISSNANLDPVAMASTISRARLSALISGEDTRSCIQRSKDCIDAYVQATKAMIDDIDVRISNGEDLPYEQMLDDLTERCYRYCQSLLEELQSLHSITTFEYPAQPSKLSASSKPSTQPAGQSSPKTPMSGPKTPQFGTSTDESGSPRALVSDLLAYREVV